MITAVKAGPVDFGNVAAGEITGYKEIPEGEHQLQGNNPIGFIQGSFTIQGKGVHAWTLILKADRNIELVQEE